MNRVRIRTTVYYPYDGLPSSPEFLKEYPIEQSVSLDVDTCYGEFEIAHDVVFRYKWCYFLQGLDICKCDDGDGPNEDPPIARIDRLKEITIKGQLDPQIIRDFVGPRYEAAFDPLCSSGLVKVLCRRVRTQLNGQELQKPENQRRLLTIQDQKTELEIRAYKH